MKALSIKQPWAHLIVQGDKTIETRTWSTDYRGPLLICASKGEDLRVTREAYPLQRPDMAFGAAVAVADLVDCRPMTEDDEGKAMCEVYPKAFAWVLNNVRAVKPFPVKGQLGLFEVDTEGRLQYVEG